MIELVTGVPGAGKTSYAIVRLIKTFGKDENLKKQIPNNFFIKDVDKAYTNINELKEDKFNNVFTLHFDDLKSYLEVLYFGAIKERLSDAQLVEKAKEFNIYRAMFIIDEFHNFFDRQDKVLVWWLTYHRHLHHHIILLTQQLGLVHSKYKAIPEIFLKAVPATLKVFDKHIILKKYTSSRMSKTSYVGKLKVKKIPAIYSFYGSGANQKNKSAVLPYIVIAVVLIILAYLYFKLYLPYSLHKETVDKNKKAAKLVTKNIEQNPKSYHRSNFIVSKDIDVSNMVSVRIYCNQKQCFYGSGILPYKLIFKKFHTVVLNRSFTGLLYSYDVLMQKDLLYMFDVEKKQLILSTKNDNVYKDTL